MSSELSTDALPPGKSTSSQPVAKVPTRWWNWWPLLIGPGAAASVYILYATDRMDDFAKPVQEKVAIGLAITAFCVSFLHLLIGRRPFHLLLSAVALTVVFREFHWEWTNKFVYISLAAIAAWGFVWRARLGPFVDRHKHVRVWLIATAVTYVLSQAIARRAFRGVIPHEAVVYDLMEEVTENAGHLMLCVTALIGPWLPARKKAAE